MARTAAAKHQQLAWRLLGVSESATLKLNAQVQAMRARGEDVVNLTAGEPDFAVGEEVKDAVRKALDANKSKYTPAAGIPELREAIARKTALQQPSARAAQASEVVVSNGGKQAIYNTFQAILNAGDEVIIPSPYWLSYPEMAKLAGAKPVFVKAGLKAEFKITPDALRKAITKKSRILVLNSPSNPTGAMYSRDELRALGEVLLEKAASRMLVVSDEIYDQITYGPIEFCSFIEAAPKLQDRVITVNGLSKSGAMTGWRIGWSVAPKWITEGILTLQGQSTSGISSLSQAAAVRALSLPPSAFAPSLELYRRRRELMASMLSAEPKLQVFKPYGAFYLFLGIGELLKKGSKGSEDSFGFAERLLTAERVAVVPGTPFGAKDFVRLSFASDEKSLEEGCRRILKFAKGK